MNMAKPKKYVHRGRVDVYAPVPEKKESSVWVWVWISFFVILLLGSCGG